MSWTYDPSAFGDTSTGTYVGSSIGVRNQIRFLIQDNQSGRPLMDDGELDWLQTQEANVYMMAAAACDSLVVRAGGVKAKRISQLEIVYSVQFYHELGGKLRARGSAHQLPYLGGMSIAEKDEQRADTDWAQPAIGRGLGDNPSAPDPVVGVRVNALTEN